MPTDPHLSFTIPNGTIDYAIAYGCPDPSADPRIQLLNEYVSEATISDPTTYTLNCVMYPEPLTFATGSFDASAIPNTASVVILPVGDFESGSTGNFSGRSLPGTYDFAALAVDTAGKIIGVKFARRPFQEW